MCRDKGTWGTYAFEALEVGSPCLWLQNTLREGTFPSPMPLFLGVSSVAVQL